jgi:chromate transport protein ChrA
LARPAVIIAGCVAMILLGLVLVTVSPSLDALGSTVAVAGIVLLAAYLIVVFRRAWSGDQKRAWAPGSLRREAREEQDAKRR